MRIAHILVCHTVIPTKLFSSIRHDDSALWFIFFHGADANMLKIVRELSSDRKAHYFPYMTNRGLSRSWNDAIILAEDCGCEAFFLLNDDVLFVDEGYVEMMKVIRQCVETKDDISVITTHGLESGASPHAGMIIPQRFACCAITKQAIKTIGYFDENFVPAYFEDIDFERRAQLAQLRPHVDPRVLVEHERALTTRSMRIEEIESNRRQVGLNKSYFERKWGENQEFTYPFNQNDFDLTISRTVRDDPYGAPFRRDA